MLNIDDVSNNSPLFPEVKLFAKKVVKYQDNFKFYFTEIQSQDSCHITIANEKKLNLCTYSYLGLINHPTIVEGAMNALKNFGCGTNGVRLLGGNLSIYRDVERKLAKFCRREDAMLFSSGFLTNQTVIRALVRPGDVIYCEARNHASIVDGCKLANAEVKMFNHDDPKELKKLIRTEPDERRKLIVADAVFSMDGDILDLPAYLSIRNSFRNTYLMVDEAHSIGVLGENGRGIEEFFDIKPENGIDIKMGTLSKAIPGNGGFIAARQELIDFLRFHARGYIFTATLTPATAGAALSALNVLEAEAKDRLVTLWKNVKHLRNCLDEKGIATTPSKSPITGVLIGNEEMAFAIAQVCFDRGLYVMPVAYPAVPRHSERIRLNVHYNHSLEQIETAVDILADAMQRIMGHKKAS